MAYKSKPSFIQSVFNANPSRQGTEAEQKLNRRERKIVGYYDLIRSLDRQILRLTKQKDNILEMIREEEKKL